ncbi:MAG: hypothetical protein AAGA25_08055, partial [Planctomycetota bacterium]
MSHSFTIFKAKRLLLLSLAVFSLGLTGCQRSLMRAPVMFDQTRADPFSNLPEDQRHGNATIFYATNRKATPDSKEGPYGRSRATSLILGQLNVEFGNDLSWD